MERQWQMFINSEGKQVAIDVSDINSVEEVGLTIGRNFVGCNVYTTCGTVFALKDSYSSVMDKTGILREIA